MKLIVGLGNPGKEYEETRHNIGYKAIDALCHHFGVELNKSKFSGRYYKGKDFVLAKPETYMNLSGDFVQPLANYFEIKPEDILVIYDDMDHKVGQIAMKPKGSHGGQNGIKDIIHKMGTDSIPRMKIGIGRPDTPQKMASYVLNKFSQTQINELNQIKNKIIEGALIFIEKDINFAMNKINTK